MLQRILLRENLHDLDPEIRFLAEKEALGELGKQLRIGYFCD